MADRILHKYAAKNPGSEMTARIDLRLRDLGLSHRNLGKILGMTRVGFTKLIRSGNFRVHHLCLMCDMLRCSPDWILGRTPSPEGPIEVKEELRRMVQAVRRANDNLQEVTETLERMTKEKK